MRKYRQFTEEQARPGELEWTHSQQLYTAAEVERIETEYRWGIDRLKRQQPRPAATICGSASAVYDALLDVALLNKLVGIVDADSGAIFSNASGETLARLAGVSVRTVARATAELKAAGWVEVKRLGHGLNNIVYLPMAWEG